MERWMDVNTTGLHCCILPLGGDSENVSSLLLPCVIIYYILNTPNIAKLGSLKVKKHLYPKPCSNLVNNYPEECCYFG